MKMIFKFKENLIIRLIYIYNNAVFIRSSHQDHYYF
jgi:hypothetical protein